MSMDVCVRSPNPSIVSEVVVLSWLLISLNHFVCSGCSSWISLEHDRSCTSKVKGPCAWPRNGDTWSGELLIPAGNVMKKVNNFFLFLIVITMFKFNTI